VKLNIKYAKFVKVKQKHQNRYLSDVITTIRKHCAQHYSSLVTALLSQKYKKKKHTHTE